MIFARKLYTRSPGIVNLVTCILLFCISGIMAALLPRVVFVRQLLKSRERKNVCMYIYTYIQRFIEKDYYKTKSQ